MVALILVIALGIYLLLMFGLTFWFERYHYYKHRFYYTTSPESAKPPSDDLEQETDAIPNPESNHRQKRRNEVCERE
ncbi:MAG TPA: hypothetical protein VEC37_10070 [Bacillota bacterium]|nr:hypothetical protein [Bacillota bacterium]